MIIAKIRDAKSALSKRTNKKVNKKITIKKTIVLMVISAFVLTGCKGGNSLVKKNYPEETREVFAMDTYMTLKAYGKDAGKALDEAVSEIERLDDLFSVGNPDSEVSIINEAGSEILSEDGIVVLDKALELYKTTDGAFDVAVFPLMEEWGFTTQNYKVPSKETIDELLKNIDAGEIEFDRECGFTSLPDNMKIDFGGIVKGYTSARIMEIFKEYDVNCGMVSLGGNVQTYNKKQDGSDWVIAIENPVDAGNYLGKIKVSDKAVITSGGYERYFEEDGVTYHHILDPKTGYPANSGLSSVTIVSEDGTIADGLSTALFIMGKDEALNFWENYGKEYKFDAVLVTDDGEIIITDGLKNAFESDNEFEIYK